MNKILIMMGCALNLLLSFIYSQNSIITIQGTGDPNTSAMTIVTSEGENKAYMFCNEFRIEEGASLVLWHPDAVLGAEITGDGEVVFVGPEVDDILQFFDESVIARTLYGVGPGKSADRLLNALRNMIVEAGINVFNACEQLLDAYEKTDGDPNPPDFVAGEAAPLLAGMIQNLRNDMRCDLIVLGNFANSNSEISKEKLQTDVTDASIPHEYDLAQNYPNPLNPITTIEFDLPKSSEVSLKVFNILGEEVTTLVSDRLSAGSYSSEWNASNMASGVYLYRLEAGDYVETRKMVLMR